MDAIACSRVGWQVLVLSRKRFLFLMPSEAGLPVLFVCQQLLAYFQTRAPGRVQARASEHGQQLAAGLVPASNANHVVTAHASTGTAEGTS